MLHITNGAITCKVTKGAYDTYYCNLGFRVINDGAGVKDNGVDNYHPESLETNLDESTQEESEDMEDEENETEEVDLSEIPLSEMSFDQLEEYADELNIDHDGIRSKKELRAVIKDHIG